ncbi:hypothetical protein HK097_010906 [Rhizophlyctis rosea]|uniref:Uncharacterized protein n=1 Tax=Rhizophlyctis rosea TaxID=64517 RepID=A0AAD5S8F1_9FUNG|nr:hypothetical protein HK097_010906 [Rhizophlyctis rosea]
MDSKLKQEEQRIDLKVLHHLNRDDHRKKLKRFRRTVSAVHAIVSNKLYRSKASSLEAYFREAWKISRAQVYRFLDCAWVLKHLEGYPSQPCRERLCRSLKRLAKNRSDIRKLWETVLEKVDNDHEAVTSTIIATIWTELLERGQVTGKPDPAGDEAAGVLSDRDRADLDGDDSDSEEEQQKNVNLGLSDGAQMGGSLDLPGADFSTPAPMSIKESAPLTLEPALDRAAADPTASLLDSIHQQATANLFRSANSAQPFQQSSTLNERTLPKPSTLTDPQSNNSTSFSWRKTTLAPSLLDAGVPAPLNRAFSLPMLRDLPRAAPQHPKWPNASIPPTQSHEAAAGQSAAPTSMVIPHTRPMWAAPALAPAHAIGTNPPTPMANVALPHQHVQHVEIPSSDVNTCADLLDSFSRKGYALQPYVHGRWVEEPASQWRIAPIDPRFRRTTLLYVPSMTTGPPTALGTMLAQTVDAAGKLGNGMGGGQPQPQQLHATRGQDLHQQPTQYVYIAAPPHGNPAFTMQQHPPSIYSASPVPPQYSPQYEYERILSLQGRYAGGQAANVVAGGAAAGGGGNAGMYTVRSLPATSPTLQQQAQDRDHAGAQQHQQHQQQQQGLPVMQTSPPLKPSAGTFGLQPWGVAQGASGGGGGADHGHHRAYAQLPLPSHVQGGQAGEQGGDGYGVELGNAAGSAW